MRTLATKIRTNARLVAIMSAYGIAVLGIAALAVVAPGIQNQATDNDTDMWLPMPSPTITAHPTTPLPSSTPHVITPAQVRHALRTCDRFGRRYQVPCIALYLRPAETRTNPDGSVITNPAGPALVAECDQSAQPSELMACFTQPAL